MSLLRGRVAVVTGAGSGIGEGIARAFVNEGACVALVGRSGEKLQQVASNLPPERVLCYPCDVSDTAQLSATFEKITSELGAPEVVIHNAVGGSFGDFLKIDPEVLRKNFEVNTMALLQLGRLAAPAMIKNTRGAILVTGNTSTYRGKANFAGFAPTKAAQRILAESMARTLGPQGVHVAYLAIDAVIDVPWTRKMAPDQPDAYFCKPADIADECWHLAHQARSAWTFDVQIRPDGEAW